MLDAPTALGDIHTSLHGTSVPRAVQGSVCLPSAQFGRRRWALPTVSFRLLSVSLHAAPAAENNCLTPADSRVDTDGLPPLSRILRSTARLLPPHRGSPSLAGRLPTPCVWEYEMVLLGSCWCLSFKLPAWSRWPLVPLGSTTTTAPSSLIRARPPLCPASVLSSCAVLALEFLPWH